LLLNCKDQKQKIVVQYEPTVEVGLSAQQQRDQSSKGRTQLALQMRQNKDIQYATLLENLQTRNILKSNFDLLKTHFLSNLNVNLFNDPWRIAMFIVPHNNYKMA
jgi:hypothetical protein